MELQKEKKTWLIKVKVPVIWATVGFVLFIHLFWTLHTTQRSSDREDLEFYLPRDHGKLLLPWPPKFWQVASWRLSDTRQYPKRNIWYLRTLSSCAHSYAKSSNHSSFPSDWKALIAILKSRGGRSRSVARQNEENNSGLVRASFTVHDRFERHCFLGKQVVRLLIIDEFLLQLNVQQ